MHLTLNQKYYDNANCSVAMFVANAVENDSRVIKTAQTLKKLGYAVMVFGFEKVSHPTTINRHTFPITLLPRPEFEMLESGQWNGDKKQLNWDLYTDVGARSLAAAMSGLNAQILHTHDMVGLSIGGKMQASNEAQSLKWLHDIHEHVSGLTEIDDKIREFYTLQEQTYISSPDILTTVSPMLSEVVKDRYNLKVPPRVILNAPRKSDFDPHYRDDIRSMLNIGKDEKLLTYVGNVKPIRGVDTIVEAMASLSWGHLAILTNSQNAYVEQLKARANELNLSDRVSFLPYVPFNCVTSALRSASIGIHPIKRYPNAEVALPNKLFEYLQAGIPVISSNAESMKKFIDTHDCGASFESENTDSLVNALNIVAQRVDNDTSWKKNLLTLSEDYCWEIQEKKIADAYDELTEGASTKESNSTKCAKLNILQLPVAQAGQPNCLSKALRAAGHSADSFSKSEHKFGYKSDISLGSDISEESIFKTLKSLWKKYEILHYHSVPLVWKSRFSGQTGIDLLLARLAGIKVFYHFRGSEIRMASVFKSVNPFHYVEEGNNIFEKFPEEAQRDFSKFVSAICNRVFVVDPELQTYVPNAVVVPRAIELKSTPVHQTKHDAVRIVHAPSRRSFKGTNRVIQAVENLKAKGLSIDLVLVENMKNADALIEYSNADIIIDQIRIGWYGVLAVEAMALGKPVVSFIRDDLKHHLPLPFPLAIANPKNIEDVLLELVTNPSLRNSLGSRGRSFVEKMHDANGIALQLERIYSEVSPNVDPSAILDWFERERKLAALRPQNSRTIRPQNSRTRRLVYLLRQTVYTARDEGLSSVYVKVKRVFKKPRYHGL